MRKFAACLAGRSTPLFRSLYVVKENNFHHFERVGPFEPDGRAVKAAAAREAKSLCFESFRLSELRACW